MAYTKTTWNDGDVITKEKMNNLETGVETANNGIPLNATKSKAIWRKQLKLTVNWKQQRW